MSFDFSGYSNMRNTNRRNKSLVNSRSIKEIQRITSSLHLFQFYLWCWSRPAGEWKNAGHSGQQWRSLAISFMNFFAGFASSLLSLECSSRNISLPSSSHSLSDQSPSFKNPLFWFSFCSGWSWTSKLALPFSPLSVLTKQGDVRMWSRGLTRPSCKLLPQIRQNLEVKLFWCCQQNR